MEIFIYLLPIDCYSIFMYFNRVCEFFSLYVETKKGEILLSGKIDNYSLLFFMLKQRNKIG